MKPYPMLHSFQERREILALSHPPFPLPLSGPRWPGKCRAWFMTPRVQPRSPGTASHQMLSGTLFFLLTSFPLIIYIVGFSPFFITFLNYNLHTLKFTHHQWTTELCVRKHPEVFKVFFERFCHPSKILLTVHPCFYSQPEATRIHFPCLRIRLFWTFHKNRKLRIRCFFLTLFT